ncbi:bifunctional 4-hydroxy-2-oxoglutarate aldolase/2-dehydro-3-deoxy-phosphogluconate aldolase [Microbacterium awajiense]|uniref:Bifunctional 4-hydroxy-2-oxoglutarate aldolase/2-dehydro-3-deoxy-phosphogluconate aldolase n=1 Tax=Microbacterium awajiense TaxID=415214 RepID=A0ABP7ALS2_9MICO
MDAPTSPSSRLEPSALLRERPVIAVLRADAARDYDAVVDTLVECGIRSVELTLTTPETIEHLPTLHRRVGAAAEIGVGTITSEDQARRAIDAGADYLVTPITRPSVIAEGLRAGVPVYPGALTPTEVHAAWTAGATAVKIFPASTVGAEYGGHLRGPFPDLRFVPSGGVGLSDIEAWLRAGALAVSVGGPLVGDALRGGSLEDLRARATQTVQLVDDLRVRS